MSIDFHGTPLVLHIEQAVELPEERTVVVADTHFGKSATFRAKGLPIPEGDTRRDLIRLDYLLSKTEAQRLVIAGDFMHAPEAQSPEVMTLLGKWLKRQRVEIILVRGNHDHHVTLPAAWKQTWMPEFQVGGLRVVHAPEDADDGTPTLVGHLHPVVPVKHTKGRPLRLPCFWQQPHLMVLPAFGSFTGGHIVEPSPADTVHAIVQDKVITLPAERLGG